MRADERTLSLLLVPIALAAVGCRQDMHNAPRYKPLAATDFFGDGRSARPLIEDTVARGHLRLDAARYTGKVNGKDVEVFPFPMTRADLLRGQERFDIFCSPCHGRLGDGEGMIPKRGYLRPPSYHIDRLKTAPVGHFFDVVTNGFGAMPSYASRVPVDDRWRIIAYIRVLQYSQGLTANQIPQDRRAYLDLPPEKQPPTPVEQREQAEGAERPATPPPHQGFDTKARTR
ncbi:MAG TPA: cytochrome c [Bryobacteraceae bacterium]|nr:cytochrome c [Bryobacteraceae bacterium]